MLALRAAIAAVVAVAACFPVARGFSVPSLGHTHPSGAGLTSRNPSLETRRVDSYRPPSFRRGTPPPPPLTMVATTPVVKRVAIVGAGVGGLTLANALSAGAMAVDEVQVFEKFDSNKPGIGGGVQINSGAVILARLGLGDAIRVRYYFEVLTVLSLLCTTLPFLPVPSYVGAGTPVEVPKVFMQLKKRLVPMNPTSCLMSVCGLLVLLYVLLPFVGVRTRTTL